VRRILTPGWVLVHTGVLAVVVTFLGLGWWQVRRALAGNVLSFGYAFEWPIFAAFLVFVWSREVREALAPPAPAPSAEDASGPDPSAPGADPTRQPEPAPRTDPTHRPPRRRDLPRHSGPAYDDSGDEPLAAYNRYLAWLNANPHASPADFPG
jgi:hypothetical protein